ncbi:branched-chain amino acid ABC transporter permease [Geobacter sp. DSM 9736]|uniref:ABC transporter permease subunit n=1 Tax=Geobacter sp. DSM 9736 TaxID=1277350 RepID=UPI000B500D18|nr:branched-chain amino acid ABC transporter permease [Geobacter sp. DSM 9736]SNB46829.1 branched-chain amino acid transport system permease protein [Geobacter sp. DSM 9736]
MRNLRNDLFFYLGMLLIFLPFLQKRIVLLPVVLLAVWGLRWFAGFAERNTKIIRFREKAVRSVVRRQRLAVGLVLAAAIIVPLGSSTYMLDVLTSALLYAILATALNITVGLTGILVLGFIGFYAVGAYTTALLTAKFAVTSFWLALPLSGLIAMLCGVLLGIPALRLKGDYLAVVTLGFGEIVRIFLTNMTEFTGGPNGVLGIKRPSLFLWQMDDPLDFYYFALVFLVIIALMVSRLADSRYGRTWVAIRENEMAAAALGINVFQKHLLSFSLSAFFGGIAGSLFAVKQGFISPDSFTFYESVMVLCMVVLGGIGNVVGSITGAFLLIVLPEFLREFALYRMLIFGAVMIAFMVFRPHGLLGSRLITEEIEDREDGIA